MKIYLYWLVKEDVPYYVGVTRYKRGRYSGEKRNEMIFIEEYNNRMEAKNGELYWISQLKSWGFVLKNKELIPIPIKYKDSDLIAQRFDITRQQADDLNTAEAIYGIRRDKILQRCIDKFFILLDSTKAHKHEF